ncbi:hypothetical protein F5I97DRAFT_2045934 [Phlebopus sp. FC_14]|nr:hypothetical protein F5I97DRAFT_2045934 [Phlebopus sp. FC_14]
MAGQPRQPLPRLSIPPSLNMQQPFDGRQPVFSPGLPSSLHQGFHPPPYQILPSSLQTPMQPFFPQQPPNAPGRPTYAHHKGHASIAHLPGFPPQTAIPITPLGQAFPMMVPPFGQPFIPRNRRAPSISIGGPPKAPLGGPGRKHSPLPPPPPPTAQKGKKVVVNFPVETIHGDDGQPPTRPPWARTPMPTTTHAELVVIPPDIETAELYPPDAWRYTVPDTVDVFLPGKVAWDALRQRTIEEKLEKLGVERGSGGGSLPIHAPHARDASISSPADPSLLYFKLNKLQQSQNPSTSNSLSSSPQPPFNLSPSPNAPASGRLQNRHGHSLSLAHAPPAAQSAFYDSTAAFNPFGPNAVLGSDSIEGEALSEVHLPPTIQGIQAPQGRLPVSFPVLATPGISRGSSRPDFVRGFGLDIPEEEEPDEEAPLDDEQNVVEGAQAHARTDSQSGPDADGMTAVAESRMHSRHVSRLSDALSLRSVGGVTMDGAIPEQMDAVPVQSPAGNASIDDLDKEAVGEWTGSEDLRIGDSGDEESIGEWSNPSDEERARHQRMQRRLLRQRRHEMEAPRRLPNFPAPPTNVFGVAMRGDYDLVSNPSDDGQHAERRNSFLGVNPLEFPLGPSSTSTPGRRPLPPLPHSRGLSGQYSVHDPALAHSRTGSEHARIEQPTIVAAPSSSMSLNPRAKPFVFGTNRRSGSWGSFDGAPPPPAPTIGHTRLPSFGKPLNASAQEFKPTGFTFRPPAGGPQIAFPVPEVARPLPVPPVNPSPVRAQQGREKRRRRGSHATASEGEDNDSGKENMASFRFPALGETPRSTRRSAPSSPRSSQDLPVGGEPFTFSGLPTVSLPPAEEPDEMDVEIDNYDQENVPPGHVQAPENEDVPSVAPSKMKRAPIPLDFKTLSSSNTVPAGVFKALVGGEKTRRTVRSRLGSREIFDHSQRPSLDDFSVPPIAMSQNRSRTRLVTDPGYKRETFESPDIFTPAIKRRSSLPALHSAHDSSLSNVSIPAINLTKRLEAQALEDKIEAMLEEKFQTLRTELKKTRHNTAGPSISPSTENAIAEVVALFRTQLQESAARGLDDSQMDARGELDLELIRDVVQQGHAESLLLLQTELREGLSRIEQSGQSQLSINTDIVPIIDQMNHRNLQVIMNTLSQLLSKMDMNMRPFADKYERDSFIEELLTALIPNIKTMRPEPVDYDVLTARLSQAVKPNIEQLIDLASDKRETAGLIVQSLLPLLPTSPSAVDTTAVVSQITTEVRRVIAPIDAHEIKEQVADLVVERLDSRLAVRDKAFNVDVVSGKVTESICGLLQSINDMAPKLDQVVESQSSLSAKNDAFTTKHEDLSAVVFNLPSQLEELKRAIDVVKESPAQSNPTENNELILSNLHLLQTTIEVVASGLNSTLGQKEELLSLQKTLHQELSDRINALPESLSAAVNVLQTAHAEFALSRDMLKHDAEEIRKLKSLNTDLQVQLAKARGAHGQVRVEKDNLRERLEDMESERDRLRVQVEELQSSVRTREAEIATVGERNSELEDALSQSLARLKASDVAAQSHQERIAELEKSIRDANGEQQNLNSQLGDLQLQVKMAEQEKNMSSQSLKLLQEQHEQLITQQSRWDTLQEQLESLTALVSQAENTELNELRRARDKSRQLEADHAVLQKRLRDLELKATNTERAASAAKANLVQAQQRASEWERRAREHEGDLELMRTKLEQTEQVQVQLDADYSLARLQLDEKEAEDRLVKDRENKLRDQVASLEAQVARLETELSKAKAQIPVVFSRSQTQAPSTSQQPRTHIQSQSPPRPDSRASTVLDDDRSRTPILGRSVSGSEQVRSETPSHSVWDSMHAPQPYNNRGYAPATPHAAPYARRPRPTAYQRSVASPTPSTVSLTPTQGEDGWWS